MTNEVAAEQEIVEGRYRIMRTIGRGGMATVYLAWDQRLRAWRALKFLLPEFANDDAVRRRFETEAHAMARLEHPNIVRVYDVGLARDVPFIAMELVDGGSLDAWTKRHGKMPARLAVTALIDVCFGIAAAHGEGVVHRDIKPHNLLVDRRGNCKVTDFGIARIEDDDNITQTGAVMGTLGFMAPEQRMDTKGTDGRADVYSLAATLYSLLTGQKKVVDLFAANEAELMSAGVHTAVAPLLLRATRYKREERFQSAEELAEALLRALPFLPDDPPHVTLVTTNAPPLPATDEAPASRPPTSETSAPRTTTPGKRTLNPAQEPPAPVGPTMVPSDDQLAALETELSPPDPARATPMPARRQALSYPPPNLDKRRTTPRPLPRTSSDAAGHASTPAPPPPSPIDSRARLDAPASRATPAPASRAAPASTPPAEAAIVITPAGARRVQDQGPGLGAADGAKDVAKFGGQIAGTLLRMLMQPFAIFAAMATVLGGLWVLVAWSAAAPVREAATVSKVASSAYLSVFNENEPKIKEDLVSLGTHPEPIDQLYGALGHAKSDAERMHVANQLLALLATETDSRRRNAPPTLAYKIQLVNDRLTRIHSARASYDDSVKVWRAAAQSSSARMGVAMGFAPEPPPEE